MKKVIVETNASTPECARWIPKKVTVRNGDNRYSITDYICSKCGYAFVDRMDECPRCRRKMLKV